jgi:cytochrome c oxidase subunit 2
VFGLVQTRSEYDHVFSIYVPIAAGVFALIVLLTAFALLRYRGRAPEVAARWHENNRLEGGYALLLALVVAFLLYVTFTAERNVDTMANRERPAVVVAVMGSKWEWAFHYPAYGITRYSGTVGHQSLVVPANAAIRFELRSPDVIHSLWIPELRYKHDLIPGSVQTVTLTFGRPGVFAGQCAEFCGLRHADMLFTVDAVSPAAFRAWAASGGRSNPS